MRPSKLLINLCLAMFLVGIGAAFWAWLGGICLLLIGIILGLAIADGILSLRRPKLHLKRDYQKRFALGQETIVEATLTNKGKRKHRLKVYDGLPDHCKHEGFPFEATLEAGQHITVSPSLTFTRRGDMTITPAFIETNSPLRLWWKNSRVGSDHHLQVYPDYLPALQYGLLATADRLQQMGIVKKRYRGVSKEFHQLRDYQDGDQLNIINWKASSRVNRLISREFQEERDQNIMLVADCSIRTRAIDQDLPILDHILNAMILISYMALKQGDKVSLMNFGAPQEEQRFLSPVKGTHAMSSVLNHLYNYQSATTYGEYEALAKRILTQQRKRTLIIILTNLRSEDQHGCVKALRLLSQKHVVLLASVQESSITQILETDIHSTKGAHRYLGATAYEQDAQEIVSQLQQQGISVMRSPLDNFSVNLANQYLDLRSEISA